MSSPARYAGPHCPDPEQQSELRSATPRTDEALSRTLTAAGLSPLCFTLERELNAAMKERDGLARDLAKAVRDVEHWKEEALFLRAAIRTPR